jgi:transcription elongation factor Elf1
MGNNLKGRIAFAQAVGDTEEVQRLLALQDQERIQKAEYARRNKDKQHKRYVDNAEYHAARVSKNSKYKRQQLIEMFGNKCGRCNRTYHSCVYDFHHVDPSTKEFILSGSSLGKSLETLKAEAAKCIMVCANCHREIHAEIRDKIREERTS